MDQSTHSSGGDERGPRTPQQNDLSRLCAELNRLGARYVVVGGWAIIHEGYPRLTVDMLARLHPDGKLDESFNRPQVRMSGPVERRIPPEPKEK
jgi:hypothetical protein